MRLINSIIQSWANEDGNVNSIEDLLTWIDLLKERTNVSIKETSIKDNTFWYYDENKGEITNIKNSFFSIKGVRAYDQNVIVWEQPLIFQSEIGYLGIICKEIDGVLNFLMQAKIEPGNVNCVQISPTIQATKSNFTRVHGGHFPYYLELFEESDKHIIIYDQIQSEQSARFYRKRNRNIILLVNKDIELYPNFRWMTLGQIKQLMKIRNLVNMDTRTVISGIPIISLLLTMEEKNNLSSFFKDRALFESIYCSDPIEMLPILYQKINRYKMLHDTSIETLPLYKLSDWEVSEYGVVCKKKADFEIKYYDIDIMGREVQHWFQPLLKAIGNATFGLISKVSNNKRLFLVRLKPEIGTFDKIEIGPTIQWEPSHSSINDNKVDRLFRKKINNKNNVIIDVILSEEGGRFYHEENKNIILEIKEDELQNVPEDYIWVDFATLNYLIQINNCLNIQLRNLLALLEL